jgi:prepilin-type N-terminal cleavage/methylation domain-containing protein
MSGGFTLIEVVIAIALMALLMGIVVVELMDNSRLDDAAVDLMTTGRTLYDEAAVKHVTLRIAYDLDEGGWWVEGYEGVFQIAGVARDNRAVEEELEEKERRKEELRDRYGSETPPEVEVDREFMPVGGDDFAPRQFPEGLRILRVETPQLKDPVEKGKAYTHFFPGGSAEPTVVVLQDEDARQSLTLAVEPWTGRMVMYPGEKSREEIEEAREDES